MEIRIIEVLLYTVTVVSIISRHGLSIDACHENQPNEHKLVLYKLSINFNCSLKWLYISSKMKRSVIKGGCGMTRIKAFKRRISFGYI